MGNTALTKGFTMSTNRGHYFTVVFTPNTLGLERGAGSPERSARVQAPGTRSAMAQANRRTFGFDRVRFLTHPSARDLATVYDTDGKIIGQLTATRNRA